MIWIIFLLIVGFSIWLDRKCFVRRRVSIMRFTYENCVYHLEFQRQHKQVRVGVIDGVDVFKDSRYPYTTAIIWKSGPKIIPDLFRSATVGAHFKDDFTLEKGRLSALRLLSKGTSLDKGFKQALWKSYMERDRKEKG